MASRGNVIDFGLRAYIGGMLTHPKNFQNVFNVQQWDFAFWVDEACADQVGGDKPRKYLQIFFKDKSLYKKIASILQDRNRLLQDGDPRIRNTLEDTWGYMRLDESAPERAKQNLVTPYMYMRLSKRMFWARCQEQLTQLLLRNVPRNNLITEISQGLWVHKLKHKPHLNHENDHESVAFLFGLKR